MTILRIENAILFLRGEKVMLDADLARLYCISTKRLNEQVKRNRDRFPSDFMFQLTQTEKDEVVANCDHLSRLKFSSMLPFAFTEHGALMLASVLNSPVAVRGSIQVVRAFIRLRRLLANHDELARKVEIMEREYDANDKQIKAVFAAIRQLILPVGKKQERGIGFRQRKD